MIPKKKFVSQVARDSRRSPFWVRGPSAGESPFEEKALAVFQPDILVTPQYQATYQRRFNLDPERLLMLAVLEDAVVCFQDNLAATCNRKRALYRDAEQWILDTDTSYLFSFENVCEALGYEAGYLRAGLLRWREEELERRAVKSFGTGYQRRAVYRSMAKNRLGYSSNEEAV